MMSARENEIESLLQDKDLDIRKSHNARWIDQKCTPDVVCLVAECIVNHCERYNRDGYQVEHAQTEYEYIVSGTECVGINRSSESHDAVRCNAQVKFTVMDILKSKYAEIVVQNVFKKPNPHKVLAKSEYSKFFMQPMEMLTYAGVLVKSKEARRNVYVIAYDEMLKFIALKERNALEFMQKYIRKVLSDSGLNELFDRFFEQQTVWAYQELKRAFSDFTLEYTPINGSAECNRIFIKVLNPLSFANNARGSERGRLSLNKITYDMLLYNRLNVRDKQSGKPKELTRKETEPFIMDNDDSAGSQRRLSLHARHFLRNFNKKYFGGAYRVSPDITCQ